jgi:uncharacterized protein YndB with AHSA1/START domain
MHASNAESNAALQVTLPSDREIVMTRTFDAPRQLVWEAMTRPEHVKEWWGPRGYTTVVQKLELRAGGAWRFVQHTPKGHEYAFNGVYREVAPPERLVFTFEFEGMPGHVLVQTIRLEEQGGRTTVTSTAVFDTVEDRDGMIQSGMERGAADSYDRLAELLRTLNNKNA